MNYALIHSYSDNNKGDLGIILSTIDFIKKNDNTAKINCVSTYNFSDPLFITEHKLLSKKVKVFPAIFGELNFYSKKDALTKLLMFFFESVRFFLIMLLPKTQFFFSRHERNSLKILRQADCIVSKGGSFLCNERNIRSRIALIRFVFSFFVIFKYAPSSKVIILCQSLGPIYGGFSRFLINKILNKSHKVVLRESFCLNQYKYIRLNTDKVVEFNDIAFFLPEKKIESFMIDEKNFNVGMTIKTVSRDKQNVYLELIKKTVIYLVDRYNAHIIVFPHVTIDNDIETSISIYSSLPDMYKNHFVIYTNNYESGELKYMYGKMSIFIGTRLHSTIFAMGCGVPSICIAYHGTKAQGIFNNMQLEQYVLSIYSFETMKYLLDDLLVHRNLVKAKILERLSFYRDSLPSLYAAVFE